MTVWAELKAELAQLLDEQPGALTGYPDPRSDNGRESPIAISLAAWATDAADSLHRRFGNDVRLQVGAMFYPERQLAGLGWRAGAGQTAPEKVLAELDPAEAVAVLDGPATIRSGYLAKHGLLLTNRSGRQLEVITTGGSLRPSIVDPRTGQRVGGYTGFVFTSRVGYPVAPEATERIPLLIGTTSIVPELGYAVPPGSWAMRVELDLGYNRAVRTPALPITIAA